MKLRKLAWLCPHEEIKAHDVIFNSLGESYPCPGGVFLPDDTLVIEKGEDGLWNLSEKALAVFADYLDHSTQNFLDDLAHALSVRQEDGETP